MMSANVSGKGNLAVNSESISGGVEAEVGAHLLKAGATARGAHVTTSRRRRCG